MRVGLLAVMCGVLILTGGAAAAQERACSANGGYPEGSPAAVLAGIRNLSSGAYAQCVEQRRQQQPQRLTPAQALSTARAAVLRLLAEPSTATFRNVQAVSGADGITTYCGEVGGPNALGVTTYRLFQAAVAPGGRPTAWLDSADPTASAYFAHAGTSAATRQVTPSPSRPLTVRARAQARRITPAGAMNPYGLSRVSKPETVMTDPEQHRYFAYADALGRGHGHVLEAPSYEAAAVGYTELYSPPVDADSEIRIFVTNLDEGEEHCFVVDVGDGQAEPCG